MASASSTYPSKPSEASPTSVTHTWSPPPPSCPTLPRALAEPSWKDGLRAQQREARAHQRAQTLSAFSVQAAVVAATAAVFVVVALAWAGPAVWEPEIVQPAARAQTRKLLQRAAPSSKATLVFDEEAERLPAWATLALSLLTASVYSSRGHLREWTDA